MMNIQRLSVTMSAMRERLRPITEHMALHDGKRRADGWTRTLFYGVLFSCVLISSGLPSTGWTAGLSSPGPTKPRQVVAAGVGYENAETASITVKTYDAETGVVLSDETYDLNVREDATSAGDKPRERIFAGGVGPGADGLSAFRLRVYDSATGHFLWEGILNLGVGNQENNAAHRAVAYLAVPQATVTQVRGRNAVGGQPEFFLRAVDAVTGELMWTDHFTTGVRAIGRAERISRAVVGQTEGLMGPSQQIEFRIQMMDDRGKQVIWDDMIEPTVEETEMAAGFDEEAQNLPVWHGEEHEEMRKESI
jgi:hypothetical protein